MTLFDIAATHGGRALLRFLVLALAFLALNLIRTALHRLVCGLTTLMRGMDRAALAQLATEQTTTRPRATWTRGATA